MVKSILNYVSEHWEQLGLLRDKPRYMQSILMSTGKNRPFEKGKIVNIIFDEEAKPFLVAKFYRSRQFAYKLENEFNVLKQFAKNGSIGVAKPIVMANIDDHEVLFESFCPGLSLSMKLSNFIKRNSSYNSSLEEFISNLFASAGLIIESLNSYNQVSDYTTFECEIQDNLEEYINIFNPDSIQTRLLRSFTDEYLQRIAHDNISKRIVNFDLIPRNIVESEEKLYVIDWEFARESHLIFVERMRFIYYLLVDLHNLGVFGGERIHNVVAESIFGDNWFNKELVEFSQKAMRVTKAKNDIFRAEFAIFFCAESVMQYKLAKYVSQEFCDHLTETMYVILGIYDIKESFLLNQERELLLKERELLLEEKEREIEALRKSWSWRFTMPLRWILDKVNKLIS